MTWCSPKLPVKSNTSPVYLIIKIVSITDKNYRISKTAKVKTCLGKYCSVVVPLQGTTGER